ncbi:MAG: RluA family pseudouridine synthase [bacterium]|nr:RluA family pseudouridine synthase [bacterium]
MTATTIRLTAAEAGQRLDRYLRKLLRDVPLGAIMKHLRQGRIRVDGGKAKGNLRLEDGMVLEFRPGIVDVVTAAKPEEERASVELLPELTPQIVHRDDDVLVVDKPAGLAVHAGSGQSGTLMDWLAASGLGLTTATFRPAAAHRLDRATSGLVAIGLTPQGLAGLAAAFRDDHVEKVYCAVVDGVPAVGEGRIDAPIRVLEDSASRGPKVVVDPVAGKPAVTRWRVLERQRDAALLELLPRTGRTHQLRVHLADLRHPIRGDRRYGGSSHARLMLHAGELRLPHPVTGAPMTLRANLPAGFRRR